MTSSEQILSLEEEIQRLRVQVKYLSNDLRVTREEFESANAAYLELYSQMEQTVSERSARLKELQGVLEAKGHELQLMLDLVQGMVFYKDAQQRYMRVNKKFADALGLPIDEIIGRTFAELFPQLAGCALDDDTHVLQTGESLWQAEHTVELHRGTTPILIDKIPYKDIDGKVIGIIGFALDLTDQKKAEEEKKELQAQFLRAQKMEAIGTLAGGIAHDFNNILTAISGNAELLKMHLQEIALDPGDDSIQSSDIIIEACVRAKELTSQLLAFSRKGTYEPSVIRIDGIVAEIVALLKGTIDKRITLSTEIAPRTSPILADKTQIHQVLMNLCTNALQAIPEDGNLRIFAEDAFLDEDFVQNYNPNAREGQYLKITVADTGCGIDAEILPHIFDPFFTTKDIGQGTGLGMSTVYGIVEKHDGLIVVDSTLGEGTRVDVYIPRFQGSGTAPEEQQVRELPGGTERILLVDDEDIVRHFMEKILVTQGYSVLTAKDGQEALEVFRSWHQAIDLVLLDLAMPKKKGLQVLAEIRQLEPGMKAVVISGHVQMAEQASHRFQGTKILPKPFQVDELTIAVRNALDED